MNNNSTDEKQPWWQYYYQLYHYQLPPGRKPTVFGPYLLLQTLGEGEFGKVKFGIEVKSGQEVAIKLIKKDNIESTLSMTKVQREISVLRVLAHPNIVKLFDVIETEKYIGIILQCATGGELFDYILAHRYLKEKDASRLFAQLISGVQYMHQNQIVHRDLKLENLLLDRNRNILITDFGFANQFALNDLMSTSCGSPCYAAPELVMNQGCYVGPAVDIWSCGVILFAMLSGYLPYDDDPANPESYNINLLYKYILNTPLIFPDHLSKEACHLISLMLVPDPQKRCTMEIIMNHPWLSPHQHLFAEYNQQQDAIVPEMDESIEKIPSLDIQNDTLQEIPSIDALQIQESPSEENDIPPIQQNDTTQHEIPMDEEIPSIETKIQPTIETNISLETPKNDNIKEEEEEDIPLSPLPTINKSANNHRPKSSTEKVLHFLSGTPKPEKRSRHVSLNIDETIQHSILHSKFLSSISKQQQQQQQQQQQPPSSPIPNISASTPHPNKRSVRLSTPPNTTSTRRKTLSLLMTENPFTKRKTSPEIQPSISSTEKHKSAGKKLMDWFKKKPTSSRSTTHDVVIPKLDYKLRLHHGAVDQEALTSKAPNLVLNEIKLALKSLGLEYKRDGDYKLICTRPKKASQPNNIRNMLLRRSSIQQPPPSLVKTIYGESNIDPGEEVRFSVELCKIKNLPGLYIVDMRRLRGNVWAYKFIYRTLLDNLKLDKNDHLSKQQDSSSSPHSISDNNTSIEIPSISDHIEE